MGDGSPMAGCQSPPSVDLYVKPTSAARVAMNEIRDGLKTFRRFPGEQWVA